MRGGNEAAAAAASPLIVLRLVCARASLGARPREKIGSAWAETRGREAIRFD